MGTAHLLSEMMVVRFDGGANRTIKQGNHNVEFYYTTLTPKAEISRE